MKDVLVKIERNGQVSRSQILENVAVIICTYKRAESLKRFLDSLKTQEKKPYQLIIVDASPDIETEKMIEDYRTETLAAHTRYFQVAGNLKGLTRQRNFGWTVAKTDLVAFFDDDVVLSENCLYEMAKWHQVLGGKTVGVGAWATNQAIGIPLLWKIRKIFGIVSSLEGGKYFLSGISTPWTFSAHPEKGCKEGDWLSGCGMMWKSSLFPSVQFNEKFSGYSQGEDLDFSLKAKRLGRLYMNFDAKLLHLHDSAGRPDPFYKGYMEVYNRYLIHHANFGNSIKAKLYFFYAWILDTVLLARNFFILGQVKYNLCLTAGRLKAFLAIAILKSNAR